jgi:hypothetical protein
VNGAGLAEALASFRQPASLEAEHRRLMDSRHSAVPWEASTAASLPGELRDALASLWRARMVAEHRSVGIFALYVLDLLGAGAPAEMLSLACRASLDEVRHAELFARLASLYSGHDETPPPGIPPMPDDASVPMRHQVAREALQLSVLAESYSSVLIGALHDRARDPAVRAALGVVLADEVHHARMGWSMLASLFADEAGGAPVRGRLQSELAGTMDDLVRSMFGDPAALPEPTLREEHRARAGDHGWLAPREEWSLFRRTIDDVWIPGLGALGLDARGLGERYLAVTR